MPRGVDQGPAEGAVAKKESGMPRPSAVVSGAVVLLITGCATIPSGPSVMVLPGAGKGFEQFRAR